MNRREFLQKSGAAAVGSGILTAAPAFSSEEAPSAGFALASAPVLVNPSADGITILCAVNAPATGWVEYGPTEALGRRAFGEVAGLRPYSDRILTFHVRDLQPGQRCFYRVHACAIDFRSAYSIRRGDEVAGEIRSFRTLNPAAPEANITIWNDTHENAATLRQLAASLRENPADLLLWNGDVTNDINDEPRIIDQFINPAGQAFADSTPLFLGRGNHDVRGRYARCLPDYITGPAGRYYYAFRHGPLAGIVLDTGEDKPDDLPVYGGLNDFAAYRAQQARWLSKAIEDPLFQSASSRIAFLHIPLVWEDPIPPEWPNVWGPGIKGWVCEDGLAKWHDLLVRARIDLVISGHIHRPAWFPPTATRPYAQLIGGGPRPEQATSITARADATGLQVTMTSLSGDMILTEHFPARRV